MQFGEANAWNKRKQMFKAPDWIWLRMIILRGMTMLDTGNKNELKSSWHDLNDRSIQLNKVQY